MHFDENIIDVFLSCSYSFNLIIDKLIVTYKQNDHCPLILCLFFQSSASLLKVASDIPSFNVNEGVIEGVKVK